MGNLDRMDEDKSFAFAQALLAHDWASSPLGPPEHWSAALKMTLELLLENRQPMFLAWGEEHTFIFNRAFAPVLGERYAEAIGQPLHDLWSGVWSGVGPYFNAAMAGHSELVEDVKFSTWASGYTESRYFTFSYSPVRDGGAVGGVICICTDTTERVLTREQVKRERDSLHEAFEKAPGFIAITTGPEHLITLANETFRRIVGGREVVGLTVAEALPEVVDQGFVAVLNEVLRSGEPFVGRGLPIRLLNAGGAIEVRYMDVIYAPRFVKGVGIVGLFCEGHDVTDQVKEAEKSRALQLEVIHLSRLTAMGTMAATLAHEINQPLAAIANYSAAGRRFLASGQTDEAIGALDAVNASVLRAGRTIGTLRSMASKKIREPAPIPLEEAVRETLTLARLAAPEVPVEISIPSALVVFGDRVQIDQVVLNVLHNAFEAVADTPRPHVRIRARSSAGRVFVSVRDNGPGVRATPLETVFDSFVSTKPSGLGLGLSISRTIVEAHGGRMWARNCRGGGAAFGFILPQGPAA